MSESRLYSELPTSAGVLVFDGPTLHGDLSFEYAAHWQDVEIVPGQYRVVPKWNSVGVVPGTGQGLFSVHPDSFTVQVDAVVIAAHPDLQSRIGQRTVVTLHFYPWTATQVMWGGRLVLDPGWGLRPTFGLTNQQQGLILMMDGVELRGHHRRGTMDRAFLDGQDRGIRLAEAHRAQEGNRFWTVARAEHEYQQTLNQNGPYWGKRDGNELLADEWQAGFIEGYAIARARAEDAEAGAR